MYCSSSLGCCPLVPFEGPAYYRSLLLLLRSASPHDFLAQTMSSSDNTPSGREGHNDNWGESTYWASGTDFVVSPLSALPALPAPAASVENDIYVPDQTMGLSLVPLPHPSMDNYAPMVSQGTDLYPLPLTHPFLQAVPVGPRVPMDTALEVQQS